mgnify:CR=1 FL=1
MMMLSFFNKIKKCLNLSFELARISFKIRNEGSFLGLAWYLLNPLAAFGLLLFLFFDNLGSQIDYYPVYLLVGVIIFNFFQQATTESSLAVVDNAALIRSVNFPREALIISIIIKNIFSHLLELVILIVLIVAMGLPFVGIIYYLPVLLLLAIFTLGVCFILSSLTIYCLDLANIWNFFCRLLWLGTPIFYTVVDQPRLIMVNRFNPMYYFVSLARQILMPLRLEIGYGVAAIFYSLVCLMIGWFLFNRLKRKFAERI